MSHRLGGRSASARCLLVAVAVCSAASWGCSSDSKPNSSFFASGANSGASGQTAGSSNGGAANGGGGADGATSGSPTQNGMAGGGTGAAAGSGGAAVDVSWTLPPNAALASCLSTNWYIKTSSSAQGNPPEYAVDGLGSTRWSSGAEQAMGMFYEIDFGGWVTIDKVVLDNSTGSVEDYPRGYEVRASKDAVDFPRVASLGWPDFAPTGGVLTIDFDPVPLQALQITTTEHSLNWWSIHELRLGCKGADDGIAPPDPLACTPKSDDGGSGNAGGAGGAGAGAGGGEGGSGEPVIDPLDRVNWTATASSTNPGDTAQGAIDGSVSTRWSSGVGQIGGEWFQVDLGGVACIGSVFLVSGGGDAAIGYTIEVSVDGVSYEQVAKGAGNPVDHIQFKPHSARYVRVNQRGAGGANWWSIQELEVK
jgi:hypothetical protein